jgi:hypothetical protein
MTALGKPPWQRITLAANHPGSFRKSTLTANHLAALENPPRQRITLAIWKNYPGNLGKSSWQFWGTAGARPMFPLAQESLPLPHHTTAADKRISMLAGLSVAFQDVPNRHVHGNKVKA